MEGHLQQKEQIEATFQTAGLSNRLSAVCSIYLGFSFCRAGNVAAGFVIVVITHPIPLFT